MRTQYSVRFVTALRAVFTINLICVTLLICFAMRGQAQMQAPSWRFLSPQSSGLPLLTNGGRWEIIQVTNKLIAISTEPNDPRLFMAELRPNSVTSFREIAVPAYLVVSYWSWPEQLTGIAKLTTGGRTRVFISSSGGVLELDFSSDTLSYLFEWHWDVSWSLHVVGTRLVWEVGSFGSRSGYYVWTEGEELQYLPRGSATVANFRLADTATGNIFGWYDSQQGFFWPGTNIPPVLFSNSTYSVSGGTEWQQFTNRDGQALYPWSPLATYADHRVVVFPEALSQGKLYAGLVGNPCIDLKLPGSRANTVFLSEDGLLIAGAANEGLYTTTIPEFSKRGVFASPVRTNGMLELTFYALPGEATGFETSTNLFNWTSVATNTVGKDGTVHLHVDPLNQVRFFRAVHK